MRRLVYPIKEIFLTVQGEGVHAGTRAVFVRTAGCNVWTGREEDRVRDTAKGCCAAWCDTDFRGTNGQNGGTHSASAIAGIVAQLWGMHDIPPTVIITGGEPSLVVDRALVQALHDIKASVHVETNGSNLLPSNVDWVTLSPKPPMPVVSQRYDEVKCVYPAGFNPLDYESYAPRHFVQPLDRGDTTIGQAKPCLDFIHANPRWRMSVQTHKLIGVP